MTAGLPLIKNVLTRLVKSVLISLGLTAAASATDVVINNFRRRNKRYYVIVKFEESRLQITGISKTIKNEAKKQRGGFLPMLLDTLDTQQWQTY